MSEKLDDFGDRMKAYEASETARRLDVSLPIYARIDGRSFSRFTRGLDRPFDARMSRCMIGATKALVEHTHARIGYTQSDEISLVWLSEGESEGFFGGKVQKLCSVLSGLATAAFMAEAVRELPDYISRLPHFDCRVFNLPTQTEAANAFLWRERDAVKNSVSMTAQAHFSHKALHGKACKDMRGMLDNAGVDYDGFPTFFKRGTWILRETIERPFTADELAAIPQKHRPVDGALITRSCTAPFDVPDFHTVANREAVIFDAAEPQIRAIRRPKAPTVPVA